MSDLLSAYVSLSLYRREIPQPDGEPVWVVVVLEEPLRELYAQPPRVIGIETPAYVELAQAIRHAARLTRVSSFKVRNNLRYFPGTNVVACRIAREQLPDNFQVRR